MGSIGLKAPSGRRLTVGYRDGYEISSVTGVAQFFGPNLRQIFSFGRKGFAEDFGLEAVGPGGRTVDRFLHQDHEMSIVAATSGVQTSYAVWRGPHHDVCIMGPGQLTRTSVLEAFGQVSVNDAADGVAITSDGRSSAFAKGSDVIVIFNRQVSIVVPDVDTARNLKPRQAGTRTRRGEVWRMSKVMDDPDQGPRATKDFTYFVGTPRGFAQVNFMDDYNRGDDALLQFLDDVDVVWA